MNKLALRFSILLLSLATPSMAGVVAPGSGPGDDKEKEEEDGGKPRRPFLPAAIGWTSSATNYEAIVELDEAVKLAKTVARSLEAERMRATANWREIEEQRVAAWQEYEALEGRRNVADSNALKLLEVAKRAADPDRSSPEEREIRQMGDAAATVAYTESRTGREVMAIRARTYGDQFGFLALRQAEVPFGMWQTFYAALPAYTREAIFETYLVRYRILRVLPRDVLNIIIAYYLTTFASSGCKPPP